MIQGVIIEQEIPKLSNNILREFCNFNELFTWNKPSGGANATIVNSLFTRNAYYGDGAVEISFTGSGQVEFNSGDSAMSKVIPKTGSYLLSYAFNKTDPDSAIVFIVEVFVNDVLYSETTITQDLYNSSGFVDGQWNVYFQSMEFAQSDVVDFNFKVQSDTTACKLYFDRLKLEFDDKGVHTPTIYTEAPLTPIEEENIISVPDILAGETTTVTASLTGAKINNPRRYVIMETPLELTTLGLIISVPLVSSDNVVKFNILNPTGSTVALTPDSVYNLKIIR